MIQIRGLSDEVHEALVRAADAQGMSLTRYVRRELEAVAARAETARHNATVISATRSAVGTTVSRDDILAALDEERRR